MRKALAAAAFLLSGCGLLTAEIEVPRIAVTVPNNRFPAAASQTPDDWCDPTQPQADPPCVAASLDYNLGEYVPALTDESVSYDLRLTDVDVTLSVGEPMTDLSSIVSAEVRVGCDPNVPGSGTVVASYVKQPGTTPTTISVAGKSEVDLGPYLDAGDLPIRVEVVLDNATPEFYADVHAGFSLVMSVDWGSYVL